MANAVTAGLVGVERSTLVGRRFHELFTVGGRLFLQTQWWPLLELQGSVAEVHLDLLDGKGGSIPTLVNALRRKDQRTDISIFVATERRKYEQELMRARRKAEELTETIRSRDLAASQAETREAEQRAQLAEQLIGIVSHDLRNPLNAIMLGAELLARAELEPKIRTTVQRITNSANRATRLTGELLDFTQARIGGGLRMNASPVDLHALVADTVEELRLAWTGRTITHYPIGSGTVDADPDRLAQVVTNLVSNAMVYGTPRTTVDITSSVGETGAEVRVHNEGKPIPPDLHQLIFQPLQRGEEQVQRGSRSVGLGLFIVREIARAHGGEASVTSTAEDGTTFTVTLCR